MRTLAADGESQRAIAAPLRINRRTVKRMLESDAPPSYRRASQGSKVDRFEPVIRATLEECPAIKAPRMTDILRDEHGYEGSVDVVKRRLRELRLQGAEPGWLSGACDWVRGAARQAAPPRVGHLLFLMSKRIPEPLDVQWQLLRERLTSWTARVAGIGVVGLSLYAVWRILRHDAAPGRDAMVTFAAIGASLLIALAIERFHPRLEEDSVEARRLTAAGRTMPAAFALLLGVFGIATHPSELAARWIAALAFLLTASGVLSVIYSALDRADARREWRRDCDGDPGNG